MPRQYREGFSSLVSKAIGDYAALKEREGLRAEEKAYRTQQGKRAQAELEATAKQREISNFALYGGQDPELVMRGSRQAAEQTGFMEDPDLVSLQVKAAPQNYVMKPEPGYQDQTLPKYKPSFDKAADTAFKRYQEFIGGKRSRGLSLEDQIALIEARGEQARQTKALPSASTRNDTLKNLQAAERVLTARQKYGEDVSRELTNVRNQIQEIGGQPAVEFSAPERPGMSFGDIIPGIEGRQEKWDRLFGKMYPEKQGELSGEDKQAFEWAQANPKDPRSAQILSRLGK